MEMAKVTSKGQITIPVSIRRRLGINEGDNLLFIDRPEGVMMVNPDMLPGGRAEASAETEIPDSEPKFDRAANEPKASAEKKPSQTQPVPAATAAPPPPEKPGPQVHGLDLNALLNEIRSIGSNI